MWAAYARQHSPLLMQITTTNPVEAWHNSLKRGPSTTVQVRTQMSLKGCVKTVMAIAKEWENRAQAAQNDAEHETLTEAKVFPQLAYFPFPLQKRIIQQLREAIS
jgi:hypothetical protein